LAVSPGGNSLSLGRWLTESGGPTADTGEQTAVASHYQVSVAAPDADEAERLGRIAVENHFAACAQVSGPITSRYWWDGELLADTEWICVLITTAQRLVSLTDALLAAHSFKVPEVVATPIVAGAPAYLAWIDTQTAAEEPKSETEG
jgi:periplasmic divalent cation tolerance protein